MSLQKKGWKSRYTVIYILLALLAVLVLQRLFTLQIIEGENYREISDSRLARNIPIKAPRGEILDRYGRPLVTNRIGYSIAIAKIDDDKQKLNAVILNLANLFQEEALEYEDTFPITKDEPFAFAFEGDTEEAKQEKKEKFLKERKYDADITAQEVLEKYRKKYAVSTDYSAKEMRTIIGIRYEMELRNFSSNNAYVFGNDIDINVVSKIKEQRDLYSCVTVFQQPIRQYVEGTTAAHILGRVGVINPEEYEALKDQNYGMNDYLGKQGAEKAFEKYLKGTDGTNSIERKINEGESQIVYSRDPVPGNSVMLTIDLDLQKALEESLERNIRKIAATHRANDGGDADAGAAVAIDLNSGEILAIGSYPTYDPAKFNSDYAKLNADPGKPMFNRALLGTYEPGSTYKMVTAIGALQEGFLTPTETMLTKGVYHYLNQDFMCSIYRTSRGTHGTINVSQALRDSCNYFFFDVGKRIGIDVIDDYARQMGLGEYTGIELEGEESKGQLAGPALREANGKQWYPGDVLQAAIGQSDNLFTPLQIANYVATVANGGTNYKAHLLKAVKSNSNAEIVEETKPEIRHQIDIKQENLNAVLKGMGMVTSEGTAKSIFADFPVKTGGKTGSAQVSRGSANGIYVGFAPFDNPQIAVAVIVEHGGSGSSVAQIAKDIFQQYFIGKGEVTESPEPVGELLP